MVPTPIDVWHVCISGFTQRNGQPHGTYRLWRLLGGLRGPRCEVALREWRADWAELAETILLSANGTAPAVKIYAYSWGAGWGFPRLADALGDRGIAVQAAVLSDPVYRSPLWIRRWRAFWPRSRVRIPANVREVYCFRQARSRLRGHDLAADSPETKIHDPVYLDRTHVYMDDSPAWHAKSCEVAGLSPNPQSPIPNP